MQRGPSLRISSGTSPSTPSSMMTTSTCVEGADDDVAHDSELAAVGQHDRSHRGSGGSWRAPRRRGLMLGVVTPSSRLSASAPRMKRDAWNWPTISMVSAPCQRVGARPVRAAQQDDVEASCAAPSDTAPRLCVTMRALSCGSTWLRTCVAVVPGAEEDRLARLDHRRRRLGDAALLFGVVTHVGDVERLLDHAPLEDGAAVHARQHALLLEALEVAADRHLRDAQVFAQHRHANGAPLLRGARRCGRGARRGSSRGLRALRLMPSASPCLSRIADSTRPNRVAHIIGVESGRVKHGPVSWPCRHRDIMSVSCRGPPSREIAHFPP